MEEERTLPFIPKEISWLSFNARVLGEAQNPSVPLLERLRFLGIYANNLDEFFRVRVALLRRLVLANKDAAKQILGGTPSDILKKVQEEVYRQSKIFEETQKALHKELKKTGVVMVRPSELTEKQREAVRLDFQRRIRHHLFPIMVEKASQIPNMEDTIPHLVVELQQEEAESKFAIIKIPTDKLPRFTVLENGDHRKNIIILDDIIRVGLPEIFTPFEFTKIKAYAVKITKDAELDIEEDISESYRDIISKSVKARKKGELVRFEYDERIPEKLLTWFTKRYKISGLEVMIAGGFFRAYRDYLRFPNLDLPNTTYKSIDTISIAHFDNSTQILNQIKERDFLLHYPYHSFDTFINFLREASIDPRIREIHITLYRMSSDSVVANALINAAHNGKKVVVTLELQARFDEVNNLFWSEKMSEAGIRVIHGVPGVKVHAKLCLVSGIENDKPVHWAAIGTGNFNERTSTLYTDALLLTTNNEITYDAQQIFQFLDHNYLRLHLKKLLLSPYDLRAWLIRKIDKEISLAQAGKPAAISAKLNQLVDEQVQEKLLQAAHAGVKVKLLIRGMCSIAPVPGSNIEVRRIVDRFLEHSRFIIFQNSGDIDVFITSADWMVRNLDKRIEVTTPIIDEKLKKEFIDIFNLYWEDNVKAVYVEPTLSNIPINGDETQRAQYRMVDFLRTKETH